MTTVQRTPSQDEEIQDNLSFIGSALSPFFLHDPVLQKEAILPLLQALATVDITELASAWPFVDEDEAQSSLQQFTQGAKQAQENDDALMDAARDFRRLFVGPNNLEAPPWGSVYTDKDNVTFGASTLIFEDWLHDKGIEVSFGASDEPEDSLGALLALLAWLAHEKPDLIPEFLCEHVLPWSSHFLELMEEKATHPIYRGLAGITRLSLEGAGRAFELEVEQPRFYR